MSDEGEKSCPLCAEEMDLTDQQLRPCKCGYEICVWCWHHIMDMAEKDETEGRCPACRTPYNKEKIVGTTAKCERLVSEMTAEKKLKSQKGKSKISEGRKQLGSARVIQRNLVYVVGLPLSFADEDLLQRREYFGQYGKVLKVSISRTATGAIQQFANVTCSVYITYSKEEEAVRCIQLVHGFTLDGRPLRACFGTTKYCHAWLRNMPCTNPDCLYLHEIGSQEDSFTKDEVISAHTRSRIQQVTGSSNSMHRRSGNVLPPPEDEFCNNSSTSSAKPVVKTPINTNNSTVSVRTSPPNSSSGTSAALPAGASWGTRQSSNQPPLIPNAPPNQRIDTCSNGPMAFSKAIPSQPFSLQIDTGKKKVNNEERTISPEKSKTETCVPVKKELDADESIASQLHSPPRTTKSLLEASNIVDSSATSSGVKSTDRIDNACSNILSLSIEENQNSQSDNVHHIIEPSISQTEEVKNTIDVGPVVSAQPDPVNKVNLPELDDDLLSFHKQRIKDPEIASTRAPDFSDALNRKHSDFKSPAFDNTDGLFSTGFDRPVLDRNTNSMGSNLENIFNNGMEDSRLFPRNDKPSPVRRYETEVGMGESSIISNILSMDFEPWDEPLTSPQNLAKFLGETDRPQGSFGAPGPRKTQNSNQSRFSFAREEEDMSHRQSTNYHEQALKQHLFGNNFSSSSRLHLEKSVSTNGLPFSSGMEQDYFTGNHSHFSSNKLPVSRTQVSAPPGFSAPSRAAAPPGFSSHGRNDPIFEPHSGNHTLDTSYLSRNQYHISSNGDNYTNGDIEFMDPAILAVGKGTFASGINNSGLETRSNYPQFNTYDESRFQSMLQQSMHIPPQHNQRFSDLGDSLSNNMSPFSQFNFHHSRNGITSNGQWDGWNEAQSVNNLGMAELLRNERLGFSNKFYSGYEESKMRMPGSGNIYNGAYGI